MPYQATRERFEAQVVRLRCVQASATWPLRTAAPRVPASRLRARGVRPDSIGSVGRRQRLDELLEDLAHAAEEDEVAVVRVVGRADVWEPSFLCAGHLDGVVAVLLAVPDEDLRLDVFEVEAFAARNGDAVPGSRSVALAEGFGEARCEPFADVGALEHFC